MNEREKVKDFIEKHCVTREDIVKVFKRGNYIEYCAQLYQKFNEIYNITIKARNFRSLVESWKIYDTEKTRYGKTYKWIMLKDTFEHFKRVLIDRQNARLDPHRIKQHQLARKEWAREKQQRLKLQREKLIESQWEESNVELEIPHIAKNMGDQSQILKEDAAKIQWLKEKRKTPNFDPEDIERQLFEYNEIEIDMNNRQALKSQNNQANEILLDDKSESNCKYKKPIRKCKIIMDLSDSSENTSPTVSHSNRLKTTPTLELKSGTGSVGQSAVAKTSLYDKTSLGTLKTIPLSTVELKQKTDTDRQSTLEKTKLETLKTTPLSTLELQPNPKTDTDKQSTKKTKPDAKKYSNNSGTARSILKKALKELASETIAEKTKSSQTKSEIHKSDSSSNFKSNSLADCSEAELDIQKLLFISNELYIDMLNCKTLERIYKNKQLDVIQTRNRSITNHIKYLNDKRIKLTQQFSVAVVEYSFLVGPLKDSTESLYYVDGRPTRIYTTIDYNFYTSTVLNPGNYFQCLMHHKKHEDKLNSVIQLAKTIRDNALFCGKLEKSVFNMI